MLFNLNKPTKYIKLIFWLVFFVVSCTEKNNDSFLDERCENSDSVSVQTTNDIVRIVHHRPTEVQINIAREKTDSLRALNICIKDHESILNLVELEYRLSHHLKTNDYMIDLYNEWIDKILAKDEIDEKSTILLFKLYCNRANAYYGSGIVEKAFDDVFAAKEFYHFMTDDCFTFFYHYRLGMIYYSQDFFDEAKIEFKNSLEILNQEYCDKDFQYYIKKQEIINNIGLSYEKVKNLDSALIYYQKGFDFLRNEIPEYDDPIKTDFLKSAILHNGVHIARTYYFMKKKDKALELLQELNSTTNLYLINDPIIVSTYFILKLRLYHEKEQFEEFDDLAKQFEGINDLVINEHAVMVNYLSLLNESYYARGMIDEAYEVLTQLSYHQKQLSNDRLNITKNNFLLHSEIHQNKEQLELEQKLRAYQEQQNTILSWLFIVIFILFSLLFAIVISYNSKRKKLAYLNEEIALKNKTLIISNKKLDSLIEQKNKVLRITAHDLRNPISSIFSLTELLKDKEQNDEVSEIREMIQQCSNNALNIINEIMVIAKADEIMKNIAVKNKEEHDLNSFIQNCVDLLNFKAENKSQKLIFEPFSTSIKIHIDSLLMTRALSNLIENAIKFSPLNAEIYLKTNLEDDKICILVEDSGIGIPKEMIKDIFNYNTPEKQRKGTDGEESFGLGLYAVKSIIDAHDGTISVESIEGEGATFKICLPI